MSARSHALTGLAIGVAKQVTFLREVLRVELQSVGRRNVHIPTPVCSKIPSYIILPGNIFNFISELTIRWTLARGPIVTMTAACVATSADASFYLH